MKWEKTLYTKDQDTAKSMDNRISECRITGEKVDWKAVCKILDYPMNNSFKSGEMNPHFRRVLVEIKILALTGEICWQHFK